MPLLRITNGFERLSDAALSARVSEIITCMTGNANFTTPKPSLAQMQTALDEFSTAVATAVSGSLLQKAIKNDKRQELIDLVHKLSYYVLFMAEGDETVARSSGFTIAKVYSSSADIDKPYGLKLQNGLNDGELVLSFLKVKGAKSYIYQFAPDPIADDTVWQAQSGTTSKVTLKGLKTCTKYWCRVVAIGVRGQAVTSDVVGRVAQ